MHGQLKRALLAGHECFHPRVRRHIGECIDGSHHLACGIPNRFRIRTHMSSRSIGAFDDELYTLDGPSFFQSDG